MKNLKLKSKIIERFGTQFAFAQLLGISEDRVSKLVCGRIIPKEAERTVIAQKLEIKPDELFEQ